jgi:hypothetical protein
VRRPERLGSGEHALTAIAVRKISRRPLSQALTEGTRYSTEVQQPEVFLTDSQRPLSASSRAQIPFDDRAAGRWHVRGPSSIALASPENASLFLIVRRALDGLLRRAVAMSGHCLTTVRGSTVLSARGSVHFTILSSLVARSPVYRLLPGPIRHTCPGRTSHRSATSYMLRRSRWESMTRCVVTSRPPPARR